MSKSLRIKTTPGGEDKYIKVNIEQDFDFIEILSLKLTQEEVYSRFCSDYGVVAGRVIVNNGFGVPNAKVSIFIPITDEDYNNDEIRSLYPYRNPSDKNSVGLRYNLLPSQQVNECHTPVGNFPTKREILDNPILMDVYEKYYKFTTTTNESGDYMIFGVPVGTQTLHVDVDLSDMGVISQKPYDFINKGYDPNQFLSPTKFNGSNNLDTLTHIKTQDIGLNVVPFWGDENNCQIGITRADIDLKYEVKPSAIFTGSIFGDDEKFSVNKNCIPRSKMGSIREQTTGEGTIEMIRKDFNGNIENFDIKGGRLINDEGAWSYQIPMNRDFIITNEFGKLIPSNDPNKGIPTSSLLRFRISMDQTGGEGRLRTRGKFLIPHNPNNVDEVDYNFDSTTKDSSFTKLEWNQIYSVKNYISRFQPGKNDDDKNFIGLKRLDDASGTTNPAPFNRVDARNNPLFLILCVLVTILSTIVYAINAAVVTLINLALRLINFVLEGICAVIEFIGKIACLVRVGSSRRRRCRRNVKNSCQPIPYVRCIAIPCGDDVYSPGCFDSEGKDGATDEYGPNVLFESPLNCIIIQLADALNVYSFEFYNDWLNGSLYAYLIKYKLRPNGREKFCEYNCDDFPNGTGDNNCKDNYLLDKCYNSCEGDGRNIKINEGYMIKVGDELYYPALTHDRNIKMFPTDIIRLGSINDCDINNIPVVIKDFVGTTFNLPPSSNVREGDRVIVSGLDSPGLSKDNSLVFNVTCLGVNINTRNTINIKRLSELGIELDEVRDLDDLPPFCTTSEVDRVIDNCEIGSPFVRNVFGWLNTNPNADLTQYNLFYSNNGANSEIYDDFRGFTNVGGPEQTRNSLYFYFGLRQGKTGLDLTFSKYFTQCLTNNMSELFIDGTINDVTTLNGNDGSIVVNVEGGVEPFIYEWVGPNNFTSNDKDINILTSGNYEVTIIDSEGNQGKRVFSVNEPLSLNCNVQSLQPTRPDINDGEIYLNSVTGGEEPFIFELFTLPTNTLVSRIDNLTKPIQETITGLSSNQYSYNVVSSDGQTCSGEIIIPETKILTLNVVTENIKCAGSNTGSYNLNIMDGVPSYIIEVSGVSSDIIYRGSRLTGLSPDTYNYIVTDSSGLQGLNSVSGEFTITEPEELRIDSSTITNVTCNGANNGSVSYQVLGGTPPYTYNYKRIDDNGDETEVDFNVNSPIIGNVIPPNEYVLRVTDSEGCIVEEGFIITEPEPLTGRIIRFSSTINVLVEGGNDGIITYRIINGPDGTVGVENNTGIFDNLPNGNYTIEIIDSKGCTITING